MPKRSSTPRRDVNQLAAYIVGTATDTLPPEPDPEPEEPSEPDQDEAKKNPAAVELGRLGGLKGGKARAKKLSKKRRSEIARAAAKKRWGTK